jgi:transcriptional regulator
MYLPPHFKSPDLADAVELMRRYSFATLISNDDQGSPYLTHLPLHLQTAEQGNAETGLRLLGHVAKANPHWRFLRDRDAAIVSFLGPHAYMSPRVYLDQMRVPTWNYLAVECRVQAKVIEEDEAKDQLLSRLIDDYDPAYLAQWRSLDAQYRHRMLAGIVGFELVVTDYQCKLKLNQHRPESFAALRASYTGGDDNDRELLKWMDRLKL